jgi:pimeloyl-ACP methyl ester carboxylesterase
MAKSGGRHRAARTRRGTGTMSLAGVAVAGAVALGLTPSVSIGAQLLAAEAPTAYFVRGTKIGDPGDAKYQTWSDKLTTWTVGEHGGPTAVQYSAGFWPVSSGHLGDPTYGAAVDEGVDALSAAIAAGADTDKPVIILGYSQGAVVVTEYMRAHPGAGNTYILVGNPNRPNGGIMQRFNGFYVPILNIPFNGATPTDGDTVLDIAYRYDGWADFPTYPLNLLATANALLGIAFLHGKADLNVNAETLAAAEQSTHGNTTYYLLESERIPLLMPFDGIVPDQVLDALEQPLRSLIETGYDRTNYGKPTSAALLPPITLPQVSTAAEPEPAPRETRGPEEDEPTAAAAADDEPIKTRRTTKTSKRTPASRDADESEAETKSDKDPRAEDSDDTNAAATDSPDSDQGAAGAPKAA